MALVIESVKDGDDDPITFDSQQFIDQLHTQYMNTITTLMQENATLMTMVNNAQVLITELKAKVEALTDL